MPRKPVAQAAVRIYPVPGAFILGIPTLEQDCPADEAERLVATGAFVYQPVEDPAPVDPEPSPADPALAQE